MPDSPTNDPNPSRLVRFLCWIFPELRWLDSLREQLEAAALATRAAQYWFAAIILIAPFLFADWIEDQLRVLFGLTGAAGDLAAFSIFMLLMLIACVALFYFSTRRARRKLRK